MTFRTTLSFTDRHHAFLAEKVEQGFYASASAAVAAAVEAMIEDEAARERALEVMADEIRRRLETPREEYFDHEEVFTGARAQLRR